MPLSELSTLDIILIVSDVLILGLLGAKYVLKGASLGKCKKIEINERDLEAWRFLLYGSIFSVWLAAITTFVVPSNLKVMFHLYVVIAIGFMMGVSVPAWVCKRFGYGGTCACDFYKYNDFYPMLVLGTIATLLLAILNVTIINSLYILLPALALSIFFYYGLPLKELKPLKYPPSLLLSDVNELQAFLMEDPMEAKLITILDAKCDFCEIQVNEILLLEEDTLNKRIRIYDMTFLDETDPIIPITLNIDTSEKVPVPTTFIFKGGMFVEQKDGVLSRNEIDLLLF